MLVKEILKKCNRKFYLQKRILNNSVASCRCFSWKQENKVPLGRRPALASLGSLWSTGSCSLERLVSFSNKGKMRSDFSLMPIFENYQSRRTHREDWIYNSNSSLSGSGMRQTPIPKPPFLYHRMSCLGPYFPRKECFCDGDDATRKFLFFLSSLN